MNDKTDREIMQMALDALYSAPLDHNSIKSRFFERRHHAIIALRERLAQPDPLQRLTDVQQEIEAALAQPKQKREWQGLTNEEVGALTVFDGLHHVEIPILANFVWAVEAKLKEKND